MADMTRDQQRAELHKAIWKIANDLRGSVDGWDFKQYVLTTLFYRYISEDLERFVDEWEAREGAEDFSYADMDDVDAEAAREAMVEARGYFMLPSQLFGNVRKRAKFDKNLNETIEGTFRAIEESSVGHYAEKDFKGLFADFDPNSNRLGGSVDERNKRLKAILDGVGDMALGDIRDNKIDAFGDAYEYLMTMYAADISTFVTGAAQPKLNQKNLNRIEIPLPNDEELKSIITYLDDIQRSHEGLKGELEKEVGLHEARLTEFRNQLLSFPEKVA